MPDLPRLRAVPTHAQDLDRARRMLAGDEAEFEAFFEESFDGLYRFALGRVDGDEALAQEVVQATLCIAFEKLDSYRGEAALFTWLCSICRSQVSHHFRQQDRAPLFDAGLVDETPEVRSALDALALGVPGAEDGVLDRELRVLVHLALDHLSPRYGRALEWKYFRGLPVTEIADRLSVSPKAAESILTRARDAFRIEFRNLCRDLERGSPPGHHPRSASDSPRSLSLLPRNEP